MQKKKRKQSSGHAGIMYMSADLRGAWHKGAKKNVNGCAAHSDKPNNNGS